MTALLNMRFLNLGRGGHQVVPLSEPPTTPTHPRGFIRKRQRGGRRTSNPTTQS